MRSVKPQKNRKKVRNGYFFCCCLFVLILSGIDGAPVFGKLDFILLESRPWWPQWQPMISSLLQQGEQPVLTDMVTSNVLRGAFGLETVSKRYDRRFGRIKVERLLKMNREIKEIPPVGALGLLLADESFSRGADDHSQGKEEHRQVRELMLEMARLLAQRSGTEETEYPYRCVINLHDFTPSWVPGKTGHWSPRWAKPSLIYEYKGKRGKEMKQLLRDNPPDNCTVYF